MAEEFLQAFRGNNSPTQGTKTGLFKRSAHFLFLAGVYDRDLMHSRKDCQLFSGSFQIFQLMLSLPPEYPDKPVIAIPCSSLINFLVFNNGCNRAIAPIA